MKILIAALDQTYNFTVPLLEADGHEVRLLTHFNKVPLIVGRPEGKAYLIEQIAEFEPDTVINAIPSMVLPTSSEYTYLGNTEASSRLETHKWETREKAAELGWKLPVVLEECDMNAMSAQSDITYLKPKGLATIASAIQVPANTTYDYFEPNTPAFVEQDLDYEYAADCMFTVANGAYEITRIIGYSSEGAGDEKLIEAGPDWTEVYTLVTLPTAAEDAFIVKCRAWLDYVVTLGGNYSGNIGGGITSSNEIYWFEQNSRPPNYCVAFREGTVQDWLDGLTTDPTKTPYVLYTTET
jgi:hypothetical protein